MAQEKDQQATKPQAAKSVPKYKNTLPNTLDLRGVSFLPDEVKELTSKDLENKRVQHAINQGILAKAE